MVEDLWVMVAALPDYPSGIRDRAFLPLSLASNPSDLTIRRNS
jgi:hypothetical protein